MMGSLISWCKSCCSCRSMVCCRQSLLKREASFCGILTAHQPHEGNALEETTQPKQYSWDTRPKQNPLDYTICYLKDGETRVKRPGEVNGQQFIIRNCSNSRIYVFDHSSQVTIDDCRDCLIVLGPIHGSLFLRDTKDSTLVCASSQLRLRDCQNIHLFVGTESDPIIEASTEIVVGPYFLSYKGIRDHFISANLSRFKCVHWSEIYDFTPNDVTPNWKRYDRTKHHPEKYICAPGGPPECYADLGISVGDKLSSFIPVTHPYYSDDVQLLQMQPKWRKHEVTFTLEAGQDIALLEELMDKFYVDTFIRGHTSDMEEPTAFLCDLKTNRNQYIFTYYQQ